MSCPAHRQQALEAEAAASVRLDGDTQVYHPPSTAPTPPPYQPVQVREKRRYRLIPLVSEVWVSPVPDTYFGDVTVTVRGENIRIPASLFRLLYEKVY